MSRNYGHKFVMCAYRRCSKLFCSLFRDIICRSDAGGSCLPKVAGMQGQAQNKAL